MTSYEKPKERPAGGKFYGFDHIEFYVSNAKQVSDWYCLRFGFERVAYRGLETGNKDSASHVVKQNDILLVFTSPLNPDPKTELAQDIAKHGDAAKCVAFTVEDARALYEKAIKRGAKSVQEPIEMKDEKSGGSVVLATIKGYGQCTHTFVQRNDYDGVFLPGFEAVDDKDPICALLDSPKLRFIDHIVGNQPDLKMEDAVKFYEQCLDFHRFWSVDDKIMHTEYSALRSIVVADFDEKVKMPINEPADGKKKSQIQEYVDFHGGAGVQHIALNTDDIIHAIKTLRKRGVKFLSVPKTYYTNLRKRLAASPVQVKEDLDVVEKLQILCDFDDQGYLLQLFTKPIEDRPTLFYEIIQRRNHAGFGAGNFKSLFQAIEMEMKARNTFVDV